MTVEVFPVFFLSPQFLYIVVWRTSSITYKADFAAAPATQGFEEKQMLIKAATYVMYTILDSKKDATKDSIYDNISSLDRAYPKPVSFLVRSHRVPTSFTISLHSVIAPTPRQVYGQQ